MLQKGISSCSTNGTRRDNLVTSFKVQPSYMYHIYADHTLIQANHHIYCCWWRYIHSHQHYWGLRPTNGLHHSVNDFSMWLIGTKSNQFRHILKKMALPHGPHARFLVVSFVCKDNVYNYMHTSIRVICTRSIAVDLTCVY